MQKAIWTLVAILAVSIAWSTGLLPTCDDGHSAITTEPWFNPVGRIDGTEWTEIPSSCYREVTDAHRAAAIDALGMASAIALTPGQVKTYLGEECRFPAGRAPYLARGLGTQAPGAWYLCIRGKQLVVHNGTAGSRHLPLVRRPVVVGLKSAPQDVFVQVWMAR